MEDWNPRMNCWTPPFSISLTIGHGKSTPDLGHKSALATVWITWPETRLVHSTGGMCMNIKFILLTEKFPSFILFHTCWSPSDNSSMHINFLNFTRIQNNAVKDFFFILWLLYHPSFITCFHAYKCVYMTVMYLFTGPGSGVAIVLPAWCEWRRSVTYSIGVMLDKKKLWHVVILFLVFSHELRHKNSYPMKLESEIIHYTYCRNGNKCNWRVKVGCTFHRKVRLYHSTLPMFQYNVICQKGHVRASNRVILKAIKTILY